MNTRNEGKLIYSRWETPDGGVYIITVSHDRREDTRQNAARTSHIYCWNILSFFLVNMPLKMNLMLVSSSCSLCRKTFCILRLAIKLMCILLQLTYSRWLPVFDGKIINCNILIKIQLPEMWLWSLLIRKYFHVNLENVDHKRTWLSFGSNQLLNLGGFPPPKKEYSLFKVDYLLPHAGLTRT